MIFILSVTVSVALTIIAALALLRPIDACDWDLHCLGKIQTIWGPGYCQCHGCKNSIKDAMYNVWCTQRCNGGGEVTNKWIQSITACQDCLDRAKREATSQIVDQNSVARVTRKLLRKLSFT
ncbi:hypothetical protein Pst134EA_022913 [Puccinia striiformis f. sp. tritici]|uniref:hypothetical protein n=1 Tax=Puccinia striiformis f. sp. tritici TaxID=168172 RepID=UPI002008B8DB|nr:hypothetical protein Pst134EA_022913 [Puccinia striiformis f. sp. tritici]KAH9455450.1 hypothetical protein Pst134EA_022913 [Puccinia striiformis f. sp. tritici]